jgi:hypothetical protein
MKKLVALTIALTLTLTLSSCIPVQEHEHQVTYKDGDMQLQYDETNDNWFMCVRTDGGLNLDCEIFYTQDEVDELVREINANHDYLGDKLERLYYMKEDVDTNFQRIEQLIEEQENVKERKYDIVEVKVVDVNDNVYLVETMNLLNPDQYILVSINQVFEIGDETHIALYYDGAIRLWNELKEFEE